MPVLRCSATGKRFWLRSPSMGMVLVILSDKEAMMNSTLIANVLILIANIGVLGLTIKVYTEFIKEKKYRQP
jgi:hypothetical protein